MTEQIRPGDNFPPPPKNLGAERPGERPKTDRLSAADALKAIAIVCVLLIHASAGGLLRTPGTADWYAALFWGSVSRAAVPIFLMVTGALMLDPAKELSLKKLWTKNIPRLLAALLFWAFLYQLYNLAQDPGLSTETLIRAVKDTLLFRHQSHLYYLHIALLVYALLPLLRVVTAHGEKSTQVYLLALWVILGLVYPAARNYWPWSQIGGIPAQYALNLTYTCVGYPLLGWYLRRYAKTTWKWAAAAGVGAGAIFVCTARASLAAGWLDQTFLSGNHPLPALLGAGICGAVFSALRGKQIPRPVTVLAQASFCVYLCHIFFLTTLSRWGLSSITGPCVLFVPLVAAVTLACSLLVWAVLSHVPGVKKWLI